MVMVWVCGWVLGFWVDYLVLKMLSSLVAGCMDYGVFTYVLGV